MRLSEKEFAQLCAKVHMLAPLGTTNAPPHLKYRNVKVYVYANGRVSFGVKLPGNAKPVEVYDSTKEYNRKVELMLLERAGKITNLRRQVKFVIQASTIINGNPIREIAYRADFVYNDARGTVIEDVKPLDPKTKRYKLTKDFSLKWKLLQAKYPDYVFAIY